MNLKRWPAVWIISINLRRRYEFELYEVWVLEDPTKADSTTKEGWKVYQGKEEINKLHFFNSSTTDGSDGAIVITDDTIIRLVGKSNTKDHNYPVRFFDYDYTNGASDIYLRGINTPSNYPEELNIDANKNVTGAVYGFGNNTMAPNKLTGLQDAKIDGFYINQANAPADRSIIGKCSYGLVESSLSE